MVQGLFVSVDPKRDTPEILSEYVKSFDPRTIGLTGVPAQISTPAVVSFYARAAIPARYAVERDQWREATLFARAVGAARSGKLDGGRERRRAACGHCRCDRRPAPIADRLKAANNDYWAAEVEAQRRAAAAWIAFAGGEHDEALGLMRSAADIEDMSEKSAISPGRILPARELLGDMLLDSGRFDEALAAYEATLVNDPKRFRSFYGAAQAAAAAGNRDKARYYFSRIVEMTDFGSDRIVRLLILTGARRAEIGGLRWSEIDQEANLWVLPAARSKNGRSFTLPVMPMMAQILAEVPRRVGRDLLFGARGAGGYADWTMGKRGIDHRSGVIDWTIHDLRRTAATRMADIGIAPHIIETILNHQSGHRRGPAGTYNRSVYAREVKAALGLWHDHLRTIVAGGARKVLRFGDHH